MVWNNENDVSQLRYCFQNSQDLPALERLAHRLQSTPYHTWPLQVAWSSKLPGAPADDDFPVRRCRLLLYEGEEIRAFQNFFEHELYVRGMPHKFVWPNGPLSEAVVDPKFGMCWPMLLQHSLKLQPLHLAVGGTPQTQGVWKGFGWTRCVPIPRFYLPLQPSRLLREMDVFRRTRSKRLVADALSVSRVGSVLARLSEGLRRPRPDADITWEEIPEFGSAIDEIWHAASHKYSAVTRRDAATLNRLYKPGDTRFRRILVRRSGRAIGWFLYSLALKPSAEMNLGYGNARTAALIDAFADPIEASHVLKAARKQFEDARVELAFGNWSHHAWQDACLKAGFWKRNTNNWLVVSKAGQAFFQSEQDVRESHFSDGDCDGPYYLVSERAT